MGPNRLTPRVARHVDAIAIARREGVTWKQIAALFDATADTVRLAYARARAGLAAGRYVVQQMPLPEPTADRTQGGVSRDTPPTQGAALAQRPPRSLPAAGTRGEEENAAALRAAGIKVTD